MNPVSLLNNAECKAAAKSIYYELDELTKKSALKWLENNGVSYDTDASDILHMLKHPESMSRAASEEFDKAAAYFTTAMVSSGIGVMLAKAIINQLSGEKNPSIIPTITGERITHGVIYAALMAVASLVLAYISKKNIKPAELPAKKEHPKDSLGFPKNIRKSHTTKFMKIAMKIAKI